MEKSGMTNPIQQCKLPAPLALGRKEDLQLTREAIGKMARTVGSARRAKWTSLVAQGASYCATWFFLIAQQAPQGEGILSYIHNGVTSVNTLADATVPEKILLAAFQLEEEGKSPFSAEDLIVASWKRFSKTFGLKGYAELYPDSNKVLSSIMGVKGLVRRHWLDKQGQKLYSLTRDGTHIVHKLQQGDETTALEPTPRLSRDDGKPFR